MQCLQRCGHAGLACSLHSISQPQQALSSRAPPFQLHGGLPSGQQRQRLLGLRGLNDPSTKSCSGISTQSHRAAVSLHQRPPVAPEQQHNAHISSHHQHRQLRDDGSLKIIMLLALSLTLLLLPWVAHHPEFLAAPFVLAVVPVVGNGVRPVLKEVAAGLVTTLRLMGMAAWFDITHELPAAAQHNHHHQHSHSNHLGGNGQQHYGSSSQGPLPPPQQQQQQYAGREVYQQQQPQQAYSYQQPRPSGPHSPWPNPAYMPANWSPPPQQQQQQQPPAAAVGVSNPSLMSHPISDAADVDWAPSSPPDPHRGDPSSLQHLRQVLAADLQTEAELGSAAAASAGSHSSSAAQQGHRSPRQRSPAGSPARGNSPNASVASVASLDSVDFGAAAPPPQQQRQQPSLPHLLEQQQAAKQQQQQQPQQQSRDPRVLSKEAKQQLYRDHHSHLHQNGGSGGSGAS